MNFDPDQDLVLFFFSGVKSGSTLVCRPCDYKSGNLNKTSVREKSRGFSELFDDLWLLLNVRRLCVVVDSLIRATNSLCVIVISA